MIPLTEPNVGQRIRTIRERQGLSYGLSPNSGLSLNAISLIERGRTPPLFHPSIILPLPSTCPSPVWSAQEQTTVFVPPQTRLRSEANGITLESLGLTTESTIKTVLANRSSGSQQSGSTHQSSGRRIGLLPGRGDCLLCGRTGLPVDSGIESIVWPLRPIAFITTQKRSLN